MFGHGTLDMYAKERDWVLIEQLWVMKDKKDTNIVNMRC